MAKNWPICFAQIYIVQIQNDMATIFPFKHAFLKVSFRPSGIEGQNEPFKRSVVAKLMEWHWFLSCRVTLRENRGKFPIFEKSPKTEQKIFFFENFKKYSPKDQVKSYSEKVLTLWFSLEMYLKNKFEEDPLCENSTCHKNKAVSNFSNTALFLKLEKNPRV